MLRCCIDFDATLFKRSLLVEVYPCMYKLHEHFVKVTQFYVFLPWVRWRILYKFSHFWPCQQWISQDLIAIVTADTHDLTVLTEFASLLIYRYQNKIFCRSVYNYKRIVILCLLFCVKLNKIDPSFQTHFVE